MVYWFGSTPPPTDPAVVDIGVQLTPIGAAIVLFVAIAMYALGKLAQTWLKQKMKDRKNERR